MQNTDAGLLVQVGMAQQNARRRITSAVDALAVELAGSGIDDELRASLQEHMANLAEQRIRLVVVGDFKSGKSALINAILGAEVLHSMPFESAPLTTVTTWSAEAGVSLHHHDYPARDDPATLQTLNYPALEELIEAYGAAAEPPVNWVEIAADVPLCRSGVDIIEVPPLISHLGGLVTQPGLLHMLQLADSVIFVTDTLHPMTAVQLDVLSYVHEALKERYVLALNKSDLATTEQRIDIERHVRERLTSAFADFDAPLIFTSARDGVWWQSTGGGGDNSGIGELTDAVAGTLLRSGLGLGYQGRLAMLRSSIVALRQGVAARWDRRVHLDRLYEETAQTLEQVESGARELERSVHEQTTAFIDRLLRDLPSIIEGSGIETTLEASPLLTQKQVESASRKIYASVISALDERFRRWIRDELTPSVEERIIAVTNMTVASLDEARTVAIAGDSVPDTPIVVPGTQVALTAALAVPLASKVATSAVLALPGLAIVGTIPFVGLLASAGSLVMLYRNRRRYAEALRKDLAARTTSALTGGRSRIATEMAELSARPLWALAETLRAQTRELRPDRQHEDSASATLAAATLALEEIDRLSAVAIPDRVTE